MRKKLFKNRCRESYAKNMRKSSQKSSKIDAKTFKKPSKNRCEKRVEKKRLQVAFARIPRGDPDPTNTYKSTRHIRPLKKDT